MGTTSEAQEDLLDVLSAIKFQAEKPTKEDIAQTQRTKARFQEISDELGPDERQLAIWSEALISFSVMAIGMNIKWAVKQEAEAREAQQRIEEDAVFWQNV